MELMGPINAEFPLPLDSRFYVDSSNEPIELVLRKKASERNAYAFMRVVDLNTGKSWEWQGDKVDNWVLFTAKGDPGEKGDTGKSLEFKWDGTKLGIRQEGDENYVYVDLKGEKGNSIEFRWNGTELGVRQEGQNSYLYVDLKGDKGDVGKSLEFKWYGDKLGVRQEGQVKYTLSESLRGPEVDKTELIGQLISTDFIDNRDPEEEGYEKDKSKYLYTTAKILIGAINEINDKLETLLKGTTEEPIK